MGHGLQPQLGGDPLEGALADRLARDLDELAVAHRLTGVVADRLRCAVADVVANTSHDVFEAIFSTAVGTGHLVVRFGVRTAFAGLLHEPQKIVCVVCGSAIRKKRWRSSPRSSPARNECAARLRSPLSHHASAADRLPGSAFNTGGSGSGGHAATGAVAALLSPNTSISNLFTLSTS
jgi:hypothetical protein